MRAAGSVVGNRNCAVQAVRSAGRESHVDSAACSGSEARTTVVRLAEVGNRGDARDKRCRTIIAQRDGLRGAGRPHKLGGERQARRGQSSIGA